MIGYECGLAVSLSLLYNTPHEFRCDMAFIEPMHRNKPNITYLLTPWVMHRVHINGLVQNCSNSSALAMELLQSCTKP